MKEINPEKYGTIISVISKEYIDNQNFEDVQNFYNQMLENPPKYENKLIIVVEGYEDDPRELYEIEEVKNYFTILDKLFPYWFYFINKNVDKTKSSLSLIMLMLVPAKIIRANSKITNIEFDIEKFENFMRVHFHHLNELTDRLGLPLEENMRISNEVNKCFM